MTTCENCGADTVDARGVCRTCGWHAGSDTMLDDDSPSLGETRAADAFESLGAGAGGGTPRPAAGTPPRTSAMSRYGAPSGGAPSSHGGTGGTARFCGTCGARLEPGEAFCGQCGTPVGAGSDYTRNVPADPASRYYVGGTGAWAGSGNDYTEQYTAPPLPPSAPYNRPSGPGGGPYAPGNFGAPAAQQTADQSQAGRIIFGLLCILGSLVSAAGALYLAFVK